MSRRLLLLAVVGLLASGCASKRTASGPSDAAVREERGQASWYGHPYHGRTTASGEVYDMNDLTAAHRTLPFGTRVEVTNLDNGRSVVVRINDRGPFKKGRIIDLSRSAARKLDMIEAGVVPVRVVLL
jgi:rare lipoprotein A